MEITNDMIDAVIQNLTDAGCDNHLIEHFLSLQKEGKKKDQLCLLSKQRGVLLCKIHEEQKRLDCLDYLIYTMKKEIGQPVKCINKEHSDK